jgi:hypothetical protein
MNNIDNLEKSSPSLWPIRLQALASAPKADGKAAVLEALKGAEGQGEKKTDDSKPPVAAPGGIPADKTTTEPDNKEITAPDKVEQKPVETPKEEPLILGKFKGLDDLTNAHRTLEGKFTQTAQQKAELEKQITVLTKTVEALQAIQTAAAGEKADELDSIIKGLEDPASTISENYFQDPKGFAKKIADIAAKKATVEAETKYAPLADHVLKKMTQEEIDNEVSQLPSDKVYIKDDIKNVMAEHPHLTPTQAYHIAKSQFVGNINDHAKDNAFLATMVAQNPDYIKSDDFLQQHIYSNPEIMGKVKDKYLSDVKESQPPMTITGRGGSAPMTTIDKPKNLKDGHTQMRNAIKNLN